MILQISFTIILELQIAILDSSSILVAWITLDFETIFRLSQIMSITFTIDYFCWLADVGILHLVNKSIH